MSVIVPIRLTDDECAALDKIVSSNETVGFENRSEFFRLLLLRERVRRGEKLNPQSFRSVNRVRAHDLKLSQSSGTFVPCPVAQINQGENK